MWNEVEFLEIWHFADIDPTLEQRFERVEQIVQYPNEGRNIVFSNTFRHSNNLNISDYESYRASSSSIPIRTTRVEK